MESSDARELARLRAADPLRWRITQLVRRGRTLPLTEAELAEIDAWRAAELARKNPLPPEETP